MNSARHGFVDMHVAASIPRGGGGQSEGYRGGVSLGIVLGFEVPCVLK